VPTRISRLTGARPQPCAAAECAQWDSNPQPPAPHAGASAKVGPRARGAATRCRPGSSAVRRRSHSRVQRPSWSPWPRTRNLRGQSPAGLPIPLVTIGNDHHAGRSDGDDRLRTQPPRLRALMGYQQPPGIECARRELNPHALRAPVLEAGASASSATRALVRRLGFEPRSSGVRARFSNQLS